jgi:hypothetical protein
MNKNEVTDAAGTDESMKGTSLSPMRYLVFRMGIVDFITGRAYVSPFSVTGVSIKTRIGSRLVLVNEPNVVGKNFGDPPPARYLPVYFVWTGRRLLPVEGKRKLEREWQGEVGQCGRS